MFNNNNYMSNCCRVCGAASTMCCAKCRSAYYCGREHQREDWMIHKLTCMKPVSSFLSLSVHTLSICRIPPDFPKNFAPRSSHFVEDGTMKLQHQYLFTWGVATCALLIIWGQREVLMLHLSGWNAPGNPKERENIDVLNTLPSGFEFQQGFILPGEYINEQLCSGPSVIIADMMNQVLRDAPWKQRLTILSGLHASHVVRASVKDQMLEIFTNPLTPECTPS